MANNIFGRIKDHLTGESLQSSEHRNPQVLPESVRMALGYDQAQLSTSHIESLMQARLQRLAFYLLMKSAENNNPIQKGLLHRMGELDYDFSGLTLNDASPALEHLDSQPEPTVQGGKLAQVSRHGFQEWADLFDRTLTDKLEGKPEANLFMLANAPYIGFDVLAAHSLKKGLPLGILRPEQFMSQPDTDTVIGYQLAPEPAGLSIAELAPDFERPESAVVFDDVIKSGGIRATTRGFWTQDGSSTPPDFVASVKAINSV